MGNGQPLARARDHGGEISVCQIFYTNSHFVFLVSVVIRHFNIMRMARFKAKTDAPLVIDSDAPLAFAVACQFFQPVRWRNPQVVQAGSGNKQPKLVERPLRDAWRQAFDHKSCEERSSCLVFEAQDHWQSVLRGTYNVK